MSEENLQQQEAETPETQEEVTQATSEGEEQKDWEAEAKKFQAIAERKSKQLEKVQSSITEEKEVTNKPNTEQTSLTREEAIFFAKGGNEKDLELAKKIADLDGISVLAAMEDDVYKAKVEARKKAEEAKANQLPASGGSPAGQPTREKTPGKMTREEHMKYAMEKLNG